MRIVFIGGTKRGYLALKSLIENHAHVVCILSLRQDEHELERYEQPIRELADRHQIPCHESKWLSERDYAGLVAEARPDLGFVVGCRVLLAKAIYQIPNLGTLALHDSLLPEYRGFAPLNWSIINGRDHTGVTLFYLNESMDGGDILAQKRVVIGPRDEGPVVYNRICEATVDLVLNAVSLFERGNPPRKSQQAFEGSFTCARVPDDGLIDWKDSTANIFNLVRALAHPYPGAFTFYQGEKLTVWKAEPAESPAPYVGRISGRVVKIARSAGWADVLTGDGILRLRQVQRLDQARQPAAEVLTSIRGTLGLDVLELLKRIKVLESELSRAPNSQPAP